MLNCNVQLYRLKNKTHKPEETLFCSISTKFTMLSVIQCDIIANDHYEGCDMAFDDT